MQLQPAGPAAGPPWTAPHCEPASSPDHTGSRCPGRCPRTPPHSAECPSPSPYSIAWRWPQSQTLGLLETTRPWSIDSLEDRWKINQCEDMTSIQMHKIYTQAWGEKNTEFKHIKVTRWDTKSNSTVQLQGSSVWNYGARVVHINEVWAIWKQRQKRSRDAWNSISSGFLTKLKVLV